MVYQLIVSLILQVSLVVGTEKNCSWRYQGMDYHSACVNRSLNYLSGGNVSEEDKKIIVDLHNKFRQNVKPHACTMFKMSWDDDLAYVAQKWADHCAIREDLQRRIPGKFTAGQNIAFGVATWKAAVTSWYWEFKKFTYGEGRSVTNVKHYTQIVWAETTKIGCGYAKCRNIRNALYVCNYAPIGNLVNSVFKPYKKCEAEKTKFYDCPTACYNEGKLNPYTCNCSCPQRPFIKGDRCEMRCGKTQDPSRCEDYSPSYCHHFINLADICPWMCKVCPYADVDQEHGNDSIITYSLTLLLLSLYFLTLI